MRKLNIKDFINTDTVLERAILTCLGKNDEAMKALERNEDGSVKPLDVELTINGVEVDIVGFFEFYEKQYRPTVIRQAKSLVDRAVNSDACEIMNQLEMIRQKTENLNEHIDWDGHYKKMEEQESEEESSSGGEVDII